MRRWVVYDDDGNDGSVFACSLVCAISAAWEQDAALGECQGSDGVDEMTVCDAGCDN